MNLRSPSSQIAAVISDVDGTLVTDEKVLSTRTEAAVRALHAHGIIFSVISSRPPRGLRMIVNALDIAVPIGAFNGGTIAAPDLSIIGEHLLPREIARRALELLTAAGAQPWVFAGQDWLARNAGGAYVGLEERTVRFPPTIVDDFEPFLDRCGKIVGVTTDFDRLTQCEYDLRAAFSDQASVARSQPQYLDVTHPLANKGVGLRTLSELLSTPLTRIAVIGDGGNDVAMFGQAGLAIAMGNALPSVQQAAHFVTESNRQDGFANAIERFIFSREHTHPGVGSRVGVHG
jgi:Cof subfamily protein (haloacid dehalogenase superfamily)